MTTWNPSDKSPDLTLSGGDLVVTLPAPLSTGNTAAAVRATTPAVAGRAFEARWTSLGAGAPYPPAIGVMLSAGSLTQTNSGTNGISYQRNGTIKGPSGDVGTGITYFMQTITVLVDASTVKFYKDGTLVYSYNHSFTLSDLYPAVWLETASDVSDQNTGAFSGLSYLPSGAFAWDDRIVDGDETLPGLGQVAAATVGTGARSIAVAQTLPGLGQTATVTSGSGAAPNVRWNPSDKNVAVTLSPDNLTASVASTGDQCVRATAAGTGTNPYFEVVFSALSVGANNSGIGLANSTLSLSAYPGDPNAIGWFANGYVEGPGIFLYDPTYAFSVGDVLGVQRFATSSTLYRNGSVVLSGLTLPSGTLYPVLDVHTSGDTSTARFTADSQSYLPAGSTAWDGTVATPGIRVGQTLPGLGQAAEATGGSPAITVAQTLPGLAQTAAVLSGSGTAVNTRWDEIDKSPAITISGAGLVAVNTSSPSSATSGMVRANIGSLAGNADDWYFEITANSIAEAGSDVSSFGIGLSNPSQSLDAGFDGSNGIGYYANGWFVASGISSFLGPTYTNGDVIGVRKTSIGVTFTKNGTFVRSQTTIPTGILRPSVILFAPNDQVTANFGATAFAALPSGAGPWFVDPATLPARNITVNQALPLLLQIARLSSIPLEPPTPVVGTGGFFPNTIAAMLQGRRVHCDFLVKFDFLSGPMYLWQGFGTLRTNNGTNWQGIGQLGQISDLESAIGGNAPQAKFTLSGVDQKLIASALDQQDEIYGRDCNVYIQFFDSEFNCLDNPYVTWAGTMDQMRVRQSGPSECQVDLTAETLFARRSLPPLGNLTDREQQRFFPGDNGLTFIPSLMSKTAIWPVIVPQS